MRCLAAPGPAAALWSFSSSSIIRCKQGKILADNNKDAVLCGQQTCFSPLPMPGQLAAVGDLHVVKPCHQQGRFSLNTATGTANAATGDNAVMLISV